MIDMSRAILEDLLNLKENNGYFVMSVNYKKELEDDKNSVVIDGDANFILPLLDDSNMAKLYAANIALSYIYKKYIDRDLMKHNTNEIPLTVWRVIADKEGPTVGLHIVYGGEVIEKEKDELLDETLKSIVEIQSAMSDKLDSLMNEFVNEKETKGIRRYQWLFERAIDGRFRTTYNNFVRMKNDDWSETKRNLREFIASGFIEKIYNEVAEVDFDWDSFKEDKFVADFFTDGESIYDLNIGFFPEANKDIV